MSVREGAVEQSRRGDGAEHASSRALSPAATLRAWDLIPRVWAPLRACRNPCALGRTRVSDAVELPETLDDLDRSLRTAPVLRADSGIRSHCAAFRTASVFCHVTGDWTSRQSPVAWPRFYSILGRLGSWHSCAACFGRDSPAQGRRSSPMSFQELENKGVLPKRQVVTCQGCRNQFWAGIGGDQADTFYTYECATHIRICISVWINDQGVKCGMHGHRIQQELYLSSHLKNREHSTDSAWGPRLGYLGGKTASQERVTDVPRLPIRHIEIIGTTACQSHLR